jgi:fatty-acyl-CoA synthase
MQGQMMDYPLTINAILNRARLVFPEKEVVSVLPSGAKHRYSYRDLYGRVVKLGNTLKALGAKPGDRVASFAWNHFRHLELYYAAPMHGYVLHTLNIRLFPEQLEYIVNHAEDAFVFVDASLLKAIEPLAKRLKSVRHWIVMTEDGQLPETELAPVHEYEALMAKAGTQEIFPPIAENDAAGLCYTSGTTGNPKGVLYSHRSTFLHTLMAGQTDVLGISERDVVLPVVPMFHANAWGQPYLSTNIGAKIVYAGSNVTPEALVNLIVSEHVTYALGVPTIWNALLQYLREHKPNLGELKRMVVGGAAVPRAMIEAFEKEFGIRIIQGWGMTEMSPLGTTCRLKRKMEDWPEAKQFEVLSAAGIPCPGVEVKILDPLGNELPWDGKSTGELLVRGPTVVKSYFRNEGAREQFTADGWFRTGDVACLDEEGYVHIADRTKDLIKSGGEWISSVEMENSVMACPGVVEAAVAARPDAKWDERPVVFVVRKPGAAVPTAKEILADLARHFAKWQLPDEKDIRFIEQIPRTSVGKFDKKVLRQQLQAG